MVKLIFKSVEINGGQMAAVRLYPPFQQMYEEVLKECNTLKNQEITTKKQTSREVCILQPTVDEWLDAYRTTLLFLKELFQYETSRSTKIAKPDGSNTTLPGN